MQCKDREAVVTAAAMSLQMFPARLRLLMRSRWWPASSQGRRTFCATRAARLASKVYYINIIFLLYNINIIARRESGRSRSPWRRGPRCGWGSASWPRWRTAPAWPPWAPHPSSPRRSARSRNQGRLHSFGISCVSIFCIMIYQQNII